MTLFLTLIFILGYVAIATEQLIRVNKAATALVTGVICWVIIMTSDSAGADTLEHLSKHLSQISEILFFLLGAMTIVELIDAHNGFDLIIRNINTRNIRSLLWIIAGLTFVLSPILDNLTTSILMVSLARKMVVDTRQRLYICGMIVISANAGGAWSPIGDVTTTMLWIGNQVTASNIIVKVILPSLVCQLIPLIVLSSRLQGSVIPPVIANRDVDKRVPGHIQNTVLILGVGILLFVPVFKMATGLPPYMAILIGLGILWIVTELLHIKKTEEDTHPVSVANALQKIDTPSILFFLGILLAVGALETSGTLIHLAKWLEIRVVNQSLIVIAFGLLSAIVDNVPLVAAAQGMYHLDSFPTDHFLWEFLAYATGTGGSILIIGSAAGVAVMGMERISFGWYLKNISLLALLGFFGGAGVYILQHMLLN